MASRTPCTNHPERKARTTQQLSASDGGALVALCDACTRAARANGEVCHEIRPKRRSVNPLTRRT